MTNRFVAILVALFFATGIAAAQERQTDLQVSSIRAYADDDGFTCRVEVATRTYAAFNASLQILLPPHERLISSGGCTVRPSRWADRSTGLATCDMGTIVPRTAPTIEIVTTPPPAGVTRTCAAFVSSDTPDTRPSNNYGEATALFSPTRPRGELGLPAEITDYQPPGCLRKGAGFAIDGVRFGETRGTRRLMIVGSDIRFYLPVTRWSARRISSILPNTPSLRAGESYYIGIQGPDGGWVSNIDRTFTICK